MFYVIVVTHKLMTKMWYLIFYFPPQSYTLCSISTINITMLVSVFETAVFCLYSDIFKTKIASKSQILEQTSKFYFQQGQSVEKKLLLFPSPLFASYILVSLFILFLFYVNFSMPIIFYSLFIVVRSFQTPTRMPNSV